MGFLNSEGLSHLVQGIKTLLAKKVDKVDGKGLSTNDYTTEEKNKLSGLQNYTHPDTAGYKHVPAGGASGQILRWQSDGTAAWGDESRAEYDLVTTDKDGLMSHIDKAKLDGIEEGANKYVHPTYTEKDMGLYKVTVDVTGHTVGAEPVTKTDITSLGIPEQDTTYSNATSESDGLMPKADKVKIDAIPDPATIATQTFVAEQIANAGHISKQIVEELPDLESASENVIYMLQSDTAQDDNVYDEYMLINGALELIGSTKTVIDAIPNSEIDNLLK